MKRFFVFLLLGAGPLAASLGAESLSLGQYMDEVRMRNPDLRGGQAEDAALALSAKQPLTAFSPQMDGQVQEQNNQTYPVGSTEISPSDTETLSWDTNLNELLSTGTQLGLDYSGDHTKFFYPSAFAQFASNPLYAGFLPDLDTYGQQVSLNISQPLWRNFMASEVNASLAKAAADADAGRAANRYQAQALLYQARQAYVELATVRQVTAILNESLKRNQKILDWTKHKYADNLADKADVLEGEASLRQVALNLAENRDDEARAVIVFNSLRGMTPTAKVGGLEALEAPERLPQPSGTRPDLEAAEAALRASDAQVASVTQSFTPDISVFATLGGAERDPEATGTMEQFQPNTLVGVKFTANLDYALYRQVLSGARQAEGYGQAQVEGKKLEVARDWAQLKASFAGVKERLALARELETIQKEKADREKERYEDGRTTEFQVLRFADDYNLSRVQTLQLTAQAEELEAQARYYNGEDQPW
ncbi:MAG TPA: TolC family protein [bacterium]|nr:TolC family protein [bacterium]